MKDRFTLTRPYTAKTSSYYWAVLNKMNEGEVYTRKAVKKHGKKMTFQALREKGLIQADDQGVYTLTQQGKQYIDFYNKNPNGNFFTSNTKPQNNTKVVTMQNKQKDSKQKKTRWKIEVRRHNGAAIYCDEFEFYSKRDALLAINAMKRASKTDAKLIS